MVCTGVFDKVIIYYSSSTLFFKYVNHLKEIPFLFILFTCSNTSVKFIVFSHED